MNTLNKGWTMSALLFYILISGYYMILLTTLLMGEKSMSVKLIDILMKIKNPAYGKIMHEMMIDDPIKLRLKDLVDSKSVNHKNGKYYISGEGNRIRNITGFYKKITGWHSNG
jgi:hypothetical protein